MAIARSHKDVTRQRSATALRRRRSLPRVRCKVKMLNATPRPPVVGEMPPPERPESLRKCVEATRAQIAVSRDVITPADAHDLFDSGMGGRKRHCEIGV